MQSVYVAEAYDESGSRIDQIIHVDESDAWEDIETCNVDADHYTVTERKLYLGQETEFHAYRNDEPTTVP